MICTSPKFKTKRKLEKEKYTENYYSSILLGSVGSIRFVREFTGNSWEVDRPGVRSPGVGTREESFLPPDRLSRQLGNEG